MGTKIKTRKVQIVRAGVDIKTRVGCCNGAHPTVIKCGTMGYAKSLYNDFEVTTVEFIDYPHPILCTRDMVFTRCDTSARQIIDEWVKTMNKLSLKLFEVENMIHPSAWNEQLGPMVSEYIKKAQAGPTFDDSEVEIKTLRYKIEVPRKNNLQISLGKTMYC